MSDERPTVCLTFDVDSMSNWIGSVGWTDPRLVSRGEFDVIGLQRILRLLAEREIRATFCVPGFTAVAYPDLIRRIAAEGHELAHHGWVHENPSGLDPAREREILQRGSAVLEEVVGERPVGYRSPAWEYSAWTIALLLEQGFLYDSGLMARDFDPYYVREGDVVRGPSRTSSARRSILSSCRSRGSATTGHSSSAYPGSTPGWRARRTSSRSGRASSTT